MNIKKIIVVLIIAVLGFYAFYGQSVTGDHKKAEAYLGKIIPVNTGQIAGLLAQRKGRTTLLYFYSSANILSRLYFNDIVRILPPFQSQGLNVIAVSVDKYPLLLANFLSDKNLPFPPYWLSEDDSALSALRIYNVHYDGAPYLLTIDKRGQAREFDSSSGIGARITEYLNGSM